MSISQFIDFPNLSDKRGSLVSIDSSVGLPFDVKEYIIFLVPKKMFLEVIMRIKDFIKLHYVYQGHVK